MFDAGGNAVDAALATAFALCVSEPWMSGLGGGGVMLIREGKTGTVHTVDFHMRAPSGLDPADYPMAGTPSEVDSALPPVKDGVNMTGPLSICTPGTVAGYGIVSERFGQLAWSDLIAPADRGHRVSWWSTLQVAADAARLAPFPASREAWLPGGFPATLSGELEDVILPMQGLAGTLSQLASAGAKDFYNGELAARLARDLQATGSGIRPDDLEGYEAAIGTPLCTETGDVGYFVPDGLTAGPTFAEARDALEGSDAANRAAALQGALRRRFAEMGHAGRSGYKETTTHISAADNYGNVVSLTTTLLSRFGSALVLPETGILMNNGIAWFDLRPGRANSIAPGAFPLTNMCPVLAERGGEPFFAVGASGGRRILPCVFQIAAMLGDEGMALEDAIAAPRFDISDPEAIVADERLDADLSGVAPVTTIPQPSFPPYFATPSCVAFENGEIVGAGHPLGPVHAAVAAATGESAQD